MSTKVVGGFVRLTIWGRNEDGIAIGANSTTPSANTTSHAYSIKMANNATLKASEITDLEFLGADIVQTTMPFGTSRLLGADVTVDDVNEDLITFLGGTLVDNSTNSEMPTFSTRIDGATATNIGCMLTSRRQDLTGAVSYQNILFENATIVATMGDLSYQGKQTVNYSISAQSTSVDLGGLSISTYNMSVPDGEITSRVINSTKPLAVTTFIADGVETTYTLDYLPTSDVVTLNATPNQQWVESVLTAPTSVATATGIVTLAAAGVSGDVIVMLYNTSFVLSP